MTLKMSGIKKEKRIDVQGLKNIWKTVILIQRVIQILKNKKTVKYKKEINTLLRKRRLIVKPAQSLLNAIGLLTKQ
jgi:hypothetical protein